MSSARVWSFPKASPVIRDKVAAPTVPHRLRADGTQEICAEDIMVIVPKATAPRPKMPSSEELGDADIEVEEAPAEFRRPAYSINATQEILADDVIEVTAAAVSNVEPHRDEIPSTLPWTVDAPDDLEFPTPPQYSGPYPAAATGPRITNFSATQVFRRRSLNVKVVVASMTLAASLILVPAAARLSQGSTAAAEGPVGISMHAPKTLDKSVRAGTLAYGTAPHVKETVAVSIDALPPVTVGVSRHHRWRR